LLGLAGNHKVRHGRWFLFRTWLTGSIARQVAGNKKRPRLTLQPESARVQAAPLPYYFVTPPACIADKSRRVRSGRGSQQ